MNSLFNLYLMCMRFSSPDYSLVLRTSAENTLKCIINIIFAKAERIGTLKVNINA